MWNSNKKEISLNLPWISLGEKNSKQLLVYLLQISLAQDSEYMHLQNSSATGKM